LQNLHDCRLVHVQSGSELPFKRSQFPRQLGSAAKRFTHFDECTNNEDAHFHGAFASQNIGRL